MDDFDLNSMLEVYMYETTHLVEQLEQITLRSEKTGAFDATEINEIFRIMHSIKGSSAMMLFDGIQTIAHNMEDLFFYLRAAEPVKADYSRLSDLILAGIDFIKNSLERIKAGQEDEKETGDLVRSIQEYLTFMRGADSGEVSKSPAAAEQHYYISANKSSASEDKLYYTATIFFEDHCEMENVRAFTIVHRLKELAEEISFSPEDIIENEHTAEVIRTNGFVILFASEQSFEELQEVFNQTAFLKDYVLEKSEKSQKEDCSSTKPELEEPIVPQAADASVSERENKIFAPQRQTMISVNVQKMDSLMDLVGELVISEAMVTQNPDLKGLALDNFQKAARQLGKITNELQDIVMSIRMVPLNTTFHKMHRIVRDMSKKLGKDVELILIGQETEVDKNIIEHISDPLMHLIRNALDHGIEPAEKRMLAGKSKTGCITLEAKASGSDVLILIKDDGQGLSKEKILSRARESGLLHKPEGDLSDKEIYSLIFVPGFSTKEEVTQFSGRGVGMDVVTQNINSVGGVVLVDSVPGQGTIITLKIPLTLAIVDGMTIGVGCCRYTIPITSIRESFSPKAEDLVTDPDGNEMIIVRGNCYRVLRIHRLYKVKTEITDLTSGIMVMVENEGGTLCVFADQLIGKQQVVVKALPDYLKNFRQASGLAGCTLLGDGSISLILDIQGLIKVS